MPEKSLIVKNPITDYKVNDFGHAHLSYEKKSFKSGVNCYGTIIMMDKKFVWFTDNEGYPYLINRKDFIFERKTRE